MGQINYRSAFAAGIVLALGTFLFLALLPFINAFFGALILFFILRPAYQLFRKWKFKKWMAASASMVLSVIVILIPVLLVIGGAATQVGEVLGYSDAIATVGPKINALFPGIDLSDDIQEVSNSLTSFFSTLFVSAVQEVGRAALTLFLTYFLLFFLLVNREGVSDRFAKIVPFNKSNSARLLEEFRHITRSVVIVTGLIAVLQGTLLGAGFFFFGVPAPLFWGVVGILFSFVPVIGLAGVWAPASIIYILQQNYFVGFGILILGLILSNADNFVRPYLQKKIGRMHPVTSLLGIIVGLPFFGLFGFIVGPLLISYFILTIGMFREEFF